MDYIALGIVAILDVCLLAAIYKFGKKYVTLRRDKKYGKKN